MALTEGRSVLLGLEIPREEDPAVQAYVGSAGSAENRSALLAGPFWTTAVRDGRQSGAMVDLLDRVRVAKTLGMPIDVVLLDQSDVADRDQAMAERLVAAVADHPGAVTITLTGDVHSRMVKGTEFDAAYEPMGFRLERSLRPGLVRSLDVRHTGGTAWICIDDDSCAARPVDANTPAGASPSALSVQLLHERSVDGYDGTYFVGELVASLPAVAR